MRFFTAEVPAVAVAAPAASTFGPAAPRRIRWGDAHDRGAGPSAHPGA